MTRVAIVTGASGNVGAHAVRRLRTEMHVVAISRHEAAFFEHGREGAVASVDRGDMAGTVSETMRRFGRLDALVHTIGAYREAPVPVEELESYTSLFEANALSAVAAMRAVLPTMIHAGHGRIVVMASAAAMRGEAAQAAYSASKAALVRIVESAAADLRGTGVTVNAILPATIDTPPNRAAAADPSRLVSIESLCELLAFAASPASAVLNGASLVATG